MEMGDSVEVGTVDADPCTRVYLHTSRTAQAPGQGTGNGLYTIDRVLHWQARAWRADMRPERYNRN
jgi:hypothetical protein